MTSQTADIKFLKRILFTLVAATLTAGTLAGIATVDAGANNTHFKLYNTANSKSL